MNKLTQKPHPLFLLAIPPLLLAGFLSGDSTLDINIHDTYFIIARSNLAILVANLFTVYAFSYWLLTKTNRKLSKWLTGIHIVLTFGGILLAMVLALFYKEDDFLSNLNANLTASITLLVLIIILGQVIFPINVIYALTKKNSTTQT